MLKDITLGQYFPGSSVIHKLDPRIKLLLMILYIVCVFMAKSAQAYIVNACVLIFVIYLSKIKVKTVLKSLKPLIFIMTFTALMNIFWTQGDELLFSFWIIKVYKDGIVFAFFMLVRLICLVTGTFVILTYTTSPVALTDAIERVTSPLKKLKIPTHEFAMMMSIALRFIPTLIEETDKIISAQKARGANFETGNLMQRTKALIPVLIPLFVSAFRRADELACAMECRLYTGGEGRTRMKILHLAPRDYISCAFAVLALSAVIYFNRFPHVI